MGSSAEVSAYSVRRTTFNVVAGTSKTVQIDCDA